MALFFLVERGPRPGLQLALAEGQAQVLGRGTTVDLPLPALDRAIALRHAEVISEVDRAYIQPLPNSGPVWVNGTLIGEATMLSAGDTVQLGETLLRLFTDGAPCAEPLEETEPLSLRDIVESVRAMRTGGKHSVLVEPDAELLRCTGCGAPGIKPPRADLWDAAWLCSNCASARLQRLGGMPTRLGNFDVLRPLAHGGMGAVYEGVERASGLHVAIKVLQSARGTTERAIQRFAREQQITMALRHPNIVCCYDVGTWEGSLFIAFEFVSGGDALTISSLTSPLQQVLWLGADLFRALGYGHDLGIVHRDVKPANLLLCPVGPQATLRGKLADFGLAKSRAGLGAPITMANESGGSLLTIGPEQLEDFVNVGPHGDLYAGAATLFWMLTGDSPLVLPCATPSASFEQKAQAILDPRRKRLRDLRPDVPSPVASLVDGLVAQDQGVRRRMHAREAAAALNAIAARIPRPLPEVRSEGAPCASDQPASHLKEALEAVEFCIRMLERAVERAAREVRDSVSSNDPARIDRAVADHEAAQADLEQALARWEKIVEAT